LPFFVRLCFEHFQVDAQCLIWFLWLDFQVELLEWPEQPLLGVHETHVLLSRLQELTLAKVRGDLEGIDSRDLSRQSLERIRLALACNLGRAILQEWLAELIWAPVVVHLSNIVDEIPLFFGHYFWAPSGSLKLPLGCPYNFFFVKLWFSV